MIFLQKRTAFSSVFGGPTLDEQQKYNLCTELSGPEYKKVLLYLAISSQICVEIFQITMALGYSVSNHGRIKLLLKVDIPQAMLFPSNRQQYRSDA